MEEFCGSIPNEEIGNSLYSAIGRLLSKAVIRSNKEAKARGYSKRVQLGCLLHDASESYISDITRPVKRQLVEYYVIEERLQKMIYEKFGLTNITALG